MQRPILGGQPTVFTLRALCPDVKNVVGKFFFREMGKEGNADGRVDGDKCRAIIENNY